MGRGGGVAVSDWVMNQSLVIEITVKSGALIIYQLEQKYVTK